MLSPSVIAKYLALALAFTAVQAVPAPNGGAPSSTTTTTVKSTTTTVKSTVTSTSTAVTTTKPPVTSTSTTSVPPVTTTSTPTPPGGLKPKFLGQISLGSVSFAKIAPNADGTSHLYLSSFAAFANDAGYFIPNVGSTLSNFNATVPTKIGGSVNWPNEIDRVPAEVFGTEGVLAAGGFLVPGKGNGVINFSPKTGATTHGDWVNLWTNSNGYFYHRTIIADVDGDGQPDILTCRANKGLFGGAKADHVYLTPVDRKNPLGKWKETVIGGHCDTFFRYIDLNGDGVPEIVSTEYWGKALTVISKKNPAGSFADPANLSYNVIDANVGNAFDVEYVDVNGDGKKDLLVTNHQGSSETPTGSVYVYEVPADISAAGAAWTKHTLLDKIPVLQGGQNQASPGAPHAFKPKVDSKEKPWIVVAGDGSQKATLLQPNSQSPTDWTYTASTLHDCKNTVGGISVGDVNGDGITDIFIPCYDNGLLVAYTFA
ncbi:hypothetical protein HDU97_002707 [Phlyctochytrium planicorne]|nr:hypothetical protein HDU97_002707 [Phlyctochytrium planicorne]